MTLEKYLEQVKDKIKDYLPEGLKDMEVTIVPLEKNNGVLFHGVSLHRLNDPAAPLLYAEDYYGLHEKGIDVESTLRFMASEYVSARDEIKIRNNIDLSYDHIKDRLFLSVINAEKNHALLENIPHQKLEDLAVTYRYLVYNDGGPFASMQIDNRFLKRWNIDQGQLHEQAVQSMEKLFQSDFCSLNQKIFGIIGIFPLETPADRNLFVLSNQYGYYGAAYISCPNVLQEIGEKIGGDFLILPSSLHELIVVKETEDINVADLIDTVKAVNRTEVSEADFLSDNIYRYDSQNQILSMIDGSDMELGMKMQ